jgi:drug/metabolite transporter (DMT)-like permease
MCQFVAARRSMRYATRIVTASSVRRDRPLLGIALMLLFGTLASHLDATSKWFSQSYPVPQLIWIRYAALTLTLLAAAPFLGWRRVTGTSAPRMQLLRGTALWLSATTFLAGLSLLPFATTKVIGSTAPLIVAAIAMPLLAERVGWWRWIAILFGFAGLVVVVRPDMGSIEWAMLFPLATACSYALYQVLTRRIAGVDGALPNLFYTALVGTILASFAVPFVWVTPSPAHLAVLFVHGLVVGFGHFVMIHALANAPASLIAPFGYVSLIWAVILGYLVFGEQPDLGTLAGGTMIALAGIALARSAATGRK